MWVSKPIYESLPYFYLVTGVLSLAASLYLNHWYWPTICLSFKDTFCYRSSYLLLIVSSPPTLINPAAYWPMIFLSYKG